MRHEIWTQVRRSGDWYAALVHGEWVLFHPDNEGSDTTELVTTTNVPGRWDYGLPFSTSPWILVESPEFSPQTMVLLAKAEERVLTAALVAVGRTAALSAYLDAYTELLAIEPAVPTETVHTPTYTGDVPHETE